MKNTKRMRIFFIAALVLAMTAWIGGNRYCLYLNEQEVQRLAQREENGTEQSEETLESANIQNKKQYIVCEEDGYLSVYLGDYDTLYMYTGIAVKSLPEELKKEISSGKTFETLEELYRFLESYSS